MIVFFLMNFIAGLSVFLLAFRLFKFNSLLDSVIALFVLYFTQIVLTQLSLGVFGGLYLVNVVLLNLAILVAVGFLCRGKKAQFNFNGFQQQAEGLLSNKIILLGVCVIFGFGLAKFFVNLINPPFGWDSLNYHFTFPVEWLKHGNLDNPIVIFDNPCPSYFPINGSIVYLWFIFPFKNVFLADLGQTPFFILSFLAIYNICRKLKVSREYSFFSAALMNITPNYFKQLSIAYVDIMVCAWFLAALNFLLNLSRRVDLKNTILFAITFGMLIGTKTIALSYSIVLALFFIYFLLKQKFKLTTIYLLTVFLFFVILTGGFAYIRNFIEIGNPLYPLTFKVFGKVIFSGVMDKTNFTVFFKPQDFSLTKVLFHEGLGAGTILFIIPSLALLIFKLFNKRKKVSREDVLLVSIFIFLYITYRYIFSFPNVRYAYPMIAIGYIISFYILSKVKITPKVIRWLVIICVFAALPEMARRSELIWSLLLSFIFFFVILFSYKYLIKHFLKLTLTIAVVLIFTLGVLNIDYNRYEYARYSKMVKYSGFWPDATEAWEWLNDHTKADNIAYIGRPVPFPLYGAGFKNNVYYVSLNKTDPAKLHYFPNSRYSWGYDFLSLHNNFEAEGNYRSSADYRVWLGNLLKRNTDYLFIYSLHQTKEIQFPLEDNWAQTHADKFSLVFTNQTIHIYKVLK